MCSKRYQFSATNRRIALIIFIITKQVFLEKRLIVSLLEIPIISNKYFF